MRKQLEGWADEFEMGYKLILGPSKLTVIKDPDLSRSVKASAREVQKNG
jgi:hypothetical protein